MQGVLVATDVQVGIADETVPTPPATAFIGEANLLRMSESVPVVDEEPQRPGVAILEYPS